jgi:Family of unknown function (DUF5681)
MSKQSRLPKASQPNGSHSSDAAHAVGYGRPPTHTRFKPGQSGNPRGRRKGRRNVRTVVDETLNQPIKIRVGNRTRSLTKLQGVILTMVSGALKGDGKALASLMTLLRSLGMTDEAPEAPHNESVTANDEALIADYLRRHGTESQQSEATEGNQQSAPIETTPASKETKS